MSKNNQQDSPLRRLVIKEAEMSEALVAELLEPFVLLSESGEALFQSQYHRLEAADKLLIALLSAKALVALGFSDTAALGPKSLSEMTGIPEGTVKRTLREMAADRLVHSAGGKDTIPAHAVSRVQERIRRILDEPAKEETLRQPKRSTGRRKRI